MYTEPAKSSPDPAKSSHDPAKSSWRPVKSYTMLPMLPSAQKTSENFNFPPCFPVVKGLYETLNSHHASPVQNVYSNLYSQAVTHPSTNRSQPCLTSVIGREPSPPFLELLRGVQVCVVCFAGMWVHWLNSFLDGHSCIPDFDFQNAYMELLWYTLPHVN